MKRINTRASASDIRAAILAWHNQAEILPRRLAEADQFEMPYTTRLPKARGIDAAPIGILSIWKYLKKLKSPTTVTGDRIIPGLAIADMQPIRDLAAAQARRKRSGPPPRGSGLFAFGGKAMAYVVTAFVRMMDDKRTLRSAPDEEALNSPCLVDPPTD